MDCHVAECGAGVVTGKDTKILSITMFYDIDVQLDLD
jgi:hypothetical protein